jgi:hypothetical protein
MYTGSLAAVSNREDWIVTSPLIDDDGTEVTLTGATMNLYLCEKNDPTTAVLEGSTADGKITFPTTTSFQWAFTPSDLSDLCAGTYLVFLRITIDSVTTQIMAATVQIVEGGPE